MVVARNLPTLFLLPETLVCDAAGARTGDDRAMIPSLVIMLVCNFVAALDVVAPW